MLKSITTDINSVDEPLRACYVEREGKFYLEVEAVDGLALEDVSGLKAALAAERRKCRDAEASLARFGGIDPVAAQDALARVNSGDLAADVERAAAARVEGLRAGIVEAASIEAKTAKAERDTLKDTLDRRERQLRKVTRDNLISSELARVRPIDDAMDALVLMAGQHISMFEEGDELVARVIDRRGEPRLDSEGRPLSVRRFMSELRDSRPSLFQPTSTVAGLGTRSSAPAASPSIGAGDATNPFSNPFSRSGWNVTKQVALQARDPARAARLRAEVGR